MSKAPNFRLHPSEVDVWKTSLYISEDDEKKYLAQLSEDEIEKANRFHFPHLKKRYIACRGGLRCLLAAYLNVEPTEIFFSYSEHGKPFIGNHEVQFNVSHSEDMAVYAFTKAAMIGVDIEQKKELYNDAVAKKYFSEREYLELSQLPEEERKDAFYRIWARKEACIKAVGEGIANSLPVFSVPLEASDDTYFLKFKEHPCYVKSFFVDKDYEAALVTIEEVEKISYYTWTEDASEVWKKYK